MTTFDISLSKVSLWRIGDSKPAPRFDIVCKPCGWEQRKQNVGIEDLSETEKLHLKYWTGLREQMVNSSVNCPVPTTDNNLRFSIGGKKFRLHARLSSRNREIGIRLYMAGDSAKPHYYKLEEQQEEIHKAFGETLEWNEVPENERSQISLSKQNTDPSDENDWQRQYEWLATRLERFNQVFQPRIKELNPED